MTAPSPVTSVPRQSKEDLAVESKAKSETTPIVKSVTEQNTIITTQPETQPETQPKTQPKTQPETQLETQPETHLVVKSVMQPDVIPTIQPEVKPKINSEKKSKTKPEIRPGAKSVIKPKATSETERETKPEIQSQVKSQVKPEAKRETRPKTTLETMSEATPETTTEKRSAGISDEGATIITNTTTTATKPVLIEERMTCKAEHTASESAQSNKESASPTTSTEITTKETMIIEESATEMQPVVEENLDAVPAIFEGKAMVVKPEQKSSRTVVSDTKVTEEKHDVRRDKPRGEVVVRYKSEELVILDPVVGKTTEKIPHQTIGKVLTPPLSRKPTMIADIPLSLEPAEDTGAEDPALAPLPHKSSTESTHKQTLVTSDPPVEDEVQSVATTVPDEYNPEVHHKHMGPFLLKVLLKCGYSPTYAMTKLVK